jgi:hypothetical protein
VGQLLTFLVGVALLGVILLLVGKILDHTPVEDEEQPTLAVVLETLDPTLATATYTATWTPEAFQPTVTPLIVIGEGGFSIDLTFVQSSWVSVVGDGTEQFTGIARPDDTQSYTFTDSVEITLANAAALELSVNGRQQPPFGERGHRIVILINSTGLQVLHPGATPTLDTSRIISPATPTLTETPAPTLTPLFEATATLAESLPTETLPPTETAVAQAADVVPTQTPTDVTPTSTVTPNAATLGLDPNLPTLTPFSFLMEGAATESVPALNADVTSSAPDVVPTMPPDNVEVSSPTPITQAETTPTTTQGQALPSQTARPSSTPTSTNTATPTVTSTPNAPTAIVPLRVTQAGLPTRKAP